MKIIGIILITLGSLIMTMLSITLITWLFTDNAYNFVTGVGEDILTKNGVLFMIGFFFLVTGYAMSGDKDL
jgi:hypothetical protein